ncbi:MAG: BRCT domain-containing protein, partial [Coriobacteriales bacterium]
LMRELVCPTVAHLPLEPAAAGSEGDAPAGTATIPEGLFDCDLRGCTVTLCGSFKLGRNAAVQGIIESLGGVVLENVTMRTDLLVMGSLPSERYIYGSYGTKAMKALDYRARGLPVQIVGEELFELMVARTQELRRAEAHEAEVQDDAAACMALRREREGSDDPNPAARLPVSEEKGGHGSSIAPRRLVPAAACL